MSITAMDIQQQGFEHSLRGYDVEQVDDFLERVATEVGEMTKEIDDLKAQLAAAPQASQAVEQPASGEADRIAQAEAAAKAAADQARATATQAKATEDELARAKATIAELNKKLAEKDTMDSTISNAFISAKVVQALDYGLDFYAPQSLLTADGRRVMIGWMQNWETCGCHLPDQRFMGMMTIPRELTIRNGRLCQNPVRELERYRANRVVYRQVTVQGDMALQSVQGRYLDLTVNLAVTPEFRWFQMTLAGDGTHYTALRYCPASGLLRLDRTYSGLPCDIVNIREFAVRPRDGKLKFRLILDRYSVELFVNDGEQAASAVIYTPLEAAAIRFSCDGTAVMDVEKYDILEEEQA